MDNSRGVVLGVFADKRIAHHGFAQVALGIAAAHALVYCRLKGAAHEVHILPYLDEYYRHAGILTDGDHILLGDIHILLQLLQYLATQRGFLFAGGGAKHVFHIAGELIVYRYAHIAHGVGDLFHIDLTHCFFLPFSFDYQKAQEKRAFDTVFPPVRGGCCNGYKSSISPWDISTTAIRAMG